MTVSDSEVDAYDRGHLAGRIDQRLAEHDAHFQKLNGTTGQLVGKVEQLASAVQRLADQATADAATRLQLASALRDADAARRASDHDQRAVRAHKQCSPYLSPSAFSSDIRSIPHSRAATALGVPSRTSITATCRAAV